MEKIQEIANAGIECTQKMDLKQLARKNISITATESEISLQRKTIMRVCILSYWVLSNTTLQVVAEIILEDKILIISVLFLLSWEILMILEHFLNKVFFEEKNYWFFQELIVRLKPLINIFILNQQRLMIIIFVIYVTVYSIYCIIF